MKIIITAPHSFCPVRVPRLCDLVAGVGALSLGKWLAPLEVSVLPSNALRSEVDLNRPTVAAETSLFHQLLNEYLGKEKGVLVDMHSFPNGLSPKEVEVEGAEEDHEVYLLLDPKGEHQLVRELYDRLVDAGVRIGLYWGDSTKNYVTHKAVMAGFVTVLVELNEDLSVGRIDEITHVIADWIRMLILTITNDTIGVAT